MTTRQDEIKRTEILATIILALGTTLTAWTAFQSAKWSGLQAIAFAESASLRTQSSQHETRAGQLVLIDVLLFVDWLDAMVDENPHILSGTNHSYRPDPAQESGFLYERFREEFKPAIDVWLRSHPLKNPDAAPTPFALPEYQLHSRGEAVELRARSEARLQDALRNNQTSDNYVLTTVLLAISLFFAGIAPKLLSKAIRAWMLGISVMLLGASVLRLLSMPVVM